MTDETVGMLTLSLTPGLGPLLIRRCIEHFGTPGEVLAAEPEAFAPVEGFGVQRAGRVVQAIRETRREGRAEREIEFAHKQGATVLGLNDPDYPTLLRHIGDPPPVLFVRGELKKDDALSLAVVGARRCTAYGREQADRFSAGCAQAGLCIVSGGAYGVDAAAHHAVLRVGGRTVAVLGSGLASPYPREHAPLFDRIAAGGGAVISELPMSTPPRAEQFPSRNRIISGLSIGTLVVEAASRSGALITARLAAEDHGREVMAVPGRVDSAASAGCHRILREGWASLVTCASEVLEQLGEAGRALGQVAASAASPEAPPAQTGLSATQSRILDAMASPMSLDALIDVTELAVYVVQSDLTLMEIRGLVRREGGQWRRKRGNE